MNHGAESLHRSDADATPPLYSAGTLNRPERAMLWIAAAWYALFIVRSGAVIDGVWYFPLFDDAAISMTYARNLAEGHGLVWNPGDVPVEGYSNFLWTLLMAAAHRLPVSDGHVGLVVMGLGGILLLLNLRVLTALTDFVVGRPDSTARLAVMGLTAAYYPLTFWTLRGFESGLIALLTSTALLAVFRRGQQPQSVRDGWLLGACLSALVLVRDDAALLALVLGAIAVWNAPRRYGLGTVVVVVVALTAAKLGHLGYRWSYYGDVVPNTYYLKLTGQALEVRLIHGISVTAATVAGHLYPVLIAAGVALWTGRLRRTGVILCLPVIVQLAYSLFVGGDAWEFFGFANRYVAPVVPLMFVVVAHLVDSCETASMRGAVRTGVVLVVAVTIGGLAWEALHKDTESTLAWQTWAVGQTAVAVALLVLSRTLMVSAAPRTNALVLALLMFLVVGRSTGSWLIQNAHEQVADAEMTRLGLWIRLHTGPDATLAVIRAGNTAYFARRRSFDLLGKSDPVIARRSPGSLLHPGHDKWDWDYSLGTHRPDLVAHVNPASPYQVRVLREHAYVELPNGLWLMPSARGRMDETIRGAIPD